MAIEGFDYKGFAQNLTQQALELVPPEFNDVQKQYVANTLLNFSTVAGEALYNDTTLNFNADTAVLITQIIAEWSFHKSVDLIRSGIPQQYWDPIMQKIAFTIFEVAKQAFKQNLPQDQILQLIEHHVRKTYVDAIGELQQKNLITEELRDRASKMSNIDDMMQQAAAQEQAAQQQAAQQQAGGAPVQGGVPQPVQGGVPQQQNQAQPKIFKLATLAMLFQRMKEEKVQTILNKFEPDDATSVIRFMEMDDLNKQVDPRIAMRCLQEIKMNMPQAKDVTPSKLIQRIQNISQYVDRAQMEQILKLERQRVKRFVFNALEGEFYEIETRIGKIIDSNIEDSV